MLKYLLLLLNFYYSNSFIFYSKNLYNYKLNSNSLSINKNFKMNVLPYNSDKFNFKKQWYPIAVPEFLNKNKPHYAQLMGNDLVIWYDKYNNKWNIFNDACPHRSAPLSEGRIEDNNLMCAYHAWQFNSTGNCISLPHAQKKNHIKLCSLKNTCASVYPTQEKIGLLWVWGEQGELGSNASIEASLKEPEIISELEYKNDSYTVIKGNWAFRDIPYSWDYFQENILDPAHVYVAHHNIIGNRYTSPTYYNIKTLDKINLTGFKQQILRNDLNAKYSSDLYDVSVSEFYQEFRAPSLVKISIKHFSKTEFILALYSLPIKQGWVRSIGTVIAIIPNNNNNNFNKIFKILSNIFINFPAWLTHVLSSFFLHQDLVFLHHQEKILAKKGYSSFSDNYSDYIFSPTPHDNGVIVFRKWLNEYANNGIPFLNKTEISLDRNIKKEDLFDVYNTHTKHCSVCMDALRNLKIIRNSLYFLVLYQWN